MKRLSLIIALTLAATSLMAQSPRQERLKQHVYFLASDSLRGRNAGTPDALKAAEYIVAQLEETGLTPLRDSWLVPFKNKRKVMDNGEVGDMVNDAYQSMYKDRNFRNVVGFIEGCDSVLKHQYIVIGAHYDHLGVRGDEVYNGADDNASGTAAVIETARILMQHRGELKRSVVICAFDGEELGLLGSSALARQLKEYDQADIRLMMSIDMVGWLKEGKRLTLEGTGTLENCRRSIELNAEKANLPVRCKNFETSIFTATDTEPFAKQGIPTLAVTTGVKSPYHKPGDDADLIDYEGLDRVVDFLSQFVIDQATGDDMDPTGRLAAKHDGRGLPLFEMGVTAGFGRTTLDFTESAFFSKSRLGYMGGITARLNMGIPVLQAAALYDVARSQFPHVKDDGSFDMFATTLYRQQSLTVPVQLLFQFPSKSTNFYIGGGAYYSWLLGTQKPHTEQIPDARDTYGLMWSLGCRLGRVTIELSSLYQLNSTYASPTFPSVKANRVNASLTYLLW